MKQNSGIFRRWISKETEQNVTPEPEDTAAGSVNKTLPMTDDPDALLAGRQFFFVMGVFLAVFVLFTLSGLSSLILAQDTESNRYAGEEVEITQSDYETLTQDTTLKPKQFTAIVTKDPDGCAGAAGDACFYLKYACQTYETLADLQAAAPGELVTLVVGADAVQSAQDVVALDGYLQSGVNVVFSELPDIHLIESSLTLRNMMGIKAVKDPAKKMDGIKLFEGFLLGGEAQYTAKSGTTEEKKAKGTELENYMDIEDDTYPYFTLWPGRKVFMVGMLDDQDEQGINNEDLPPILWRYTWKNGFVYVCNGEFLRTTNGIGFYNAIMADAQKVFVYPIMNAQTVLINNFPMLSDENSEVLMDLYSQRSDQLAASAILSRVVSIMEKNGEVMSCFLSSMYDYETGLDTLPLRVDMMNYFVRQIVRKNGEIGICGYEKGGESSVAKMTYDMELMADQTEDYRMKAFSPGNMTSDEYLPLLQKGELLENVRTIVKDLMENGRAYRYSYFNDTVLNLPVTINGYRHTNRDDVTLRSFQTALGVSNLSIDFSRIIYPESDEDDWNRLATDWARFSYTYWYPFRYFDSVAISQADERARRFLVMDYEYKYKNGKLTIDLQNFDTEAYLILKTPEYRIVDMEGATWEKIENGVYMLKAQNARITASLCGRGQAEGERME